MKMASIAMREPNRLTDAGRGGKGKSNTWALRAMGEPTPAVDARCSYCPQPVWTYSAAGVPLCESCAEAKAG